MTEKILSILSAAAVFTAVTAAAAAQENRGISIVVNGLETETDTAPVIINDRTMVPLRAIAESLGCEVLWDGDNRGIIVCRNMHLYNFRIGFDTAFDIYNNALENTYLLDSAPVIINDRTMLPLRAVAEMMDADVSWDPESQTVNITVAQSEQYDISGYEDSFLSFEAAFCGVSDKYKSYSLGTSPTVTGRIVLESDEYMDFVLYPELAETTVKNFVELAKSGFYNNTVFHRVIKDFVIQGGGYFKTDEGKTTKAADSITGEFLSNGYMNLLPHTTGALSMARTSDPNSASSQFFICDSDCTSLNGQYAVFGYVTSGEDLIHRIASVQTDADDCPVEYVVIKEIIIN